MRLAAIVLTGYVPINVTHPWGLPYTYRGFNIYTLVLMTAKLY